MGADGIQDLWVAVQRIVNSEVLGELLIFQHPVKDECYGVTAHVTTGYVNDPARRDLTTECIEKEVFSTWEEAREWAFDYLNSAENGE